MDPTFDPRLAGVGATELAYLAGMSDVGQAYYCRVPQREGGGEPCFRGSVADFVAANAALIEQMRNEARSCPRCAKSNAVVLPFCNGCGGNLSDAAQEFTENVCMAFVYGIERCSRGPLGLSLRSEERDVLVYDDLLARSSCHLNAIPTDCHLPDWRHLLRNPSRGKELMRRLDEASWKAVREQFWDDEGWRTTNFCAGAFASAEDFRSQIYAGINSVPSQFQIHLQYIVPAIQPLDYHAFLHGKRFVKDRWLPLQYVMDSLNALELTGGLPHAHTMSMDAIFAGIAECGGPVYADAYAEAIRRYNQTHRACANWRPEHFEVVVVHRHPSLRPELLGAAADSASSAGGAGNSSIVEVRSLRGGEMPASASLPPQELEKRDKRAIQSYGRPYSHDGCPAADSYYKLARRPGQVLSAEEWAIGVEARS